MSTRRKVRIYNIYRNYRAENTVTKQLLRKTEMRTLRSTTEHTLFDRKRSEEIRKIFEIQDVVRWARN